MPITALYAGLLAPIFVVLALRVIGLSRGAGVAIGDGGDKLLHGACACMQTLLRGARVATGHPDGEGRRRI